MGGGGVRSADALRDGSCCATNRTQVDGHSRRERKKNKKEGKKAERKRLPAHPECTHIASKP
jgi:hypothetical protein